MRRLSEANLEAAVEIEMASYPADEAASPENMRFRRANAGAFFLEATLKSVSDERNQHILPCLGTVTMASNVNLGMHTHYHHQ